MTLDDLLQLQALRVKAGYDNPALIDRVIDGAPETPEIRQLCAKVSAHLYAEVDSLCTLLDLSKRRFVEAAVVEAVNRAHNVLRATGLGDRLNDGEGV